MKMQRHLFQTHVTRGGEKIDIDVFFYYTPPYRGTRYQPPEGAEIEIVDVLGADDKPLPVGFELTDEEYDDIIDEIFDFTEQEPEP